MNKGNTIESRQLKSSRPEIPSGPLEKLLFRERRADRTSSGVKLQLEGRS